jgi:hypothetical protein
MRELARPIQTRAPVLSTTRYHPLPTPQTSPVQDQEVGSDVGLIGAVLAGLDDPPPVSAWGAGRVRGQGVRPLPPGAYIPRLPGSAPPWMGVGVGGQRSGPVVMVTPPPTPPHTPLQVTSPARTRAIGTHTTPIHPPRPRIHPLSPNVRLSAIPNAHMPTRLSPTSNDPPRSPSPVHSISEDMHPPSRDDSLLARVFSGPRSAETGHTHALESSVGSSGQSSYRTAEAGSGVESRRSLSVASGGNVSLASRGSLSATSGGRSSGTASYRTWERGVVRSGQVVVLSADEADEVGYHRYGYRSTMPPIPSEHVGEADIGETAVPEPSSNWHTPSNFHGPPTLYSSQPTSPLSPPSPLDAIRPLRHVGPNIHSRTREPGALSHPRGPTIQPRTIVLPAPLSPARYPYSAWRAPEPTPQQHGGESQIHPVPWSLLQGRPNSSESGLAGWASGRAPPNESRVVAPYVNGSSSLSSLSNIEDRYPNMGARDSRDLGMQRN